MTLLATPYGSHPADTERLRAESCLPLPRLPTTTGLSALRAEAGRLEQGARRRDFTMECMDGSRRRTTTLGGQVISDASRLVPGLYAELLAFVSGLIGDTALPVPDPMERHVLNILRQEGDTHGAHTDDSPCALVVFLEAPDAARCLLRSDTAAHRVTPLTRTGTRRTVLNFAHTTPGTVPRATPSGRRLYA